MTAGMPGTGIGGLFYLLSALLMPVRELWRAMCGRSSAEQRRNVLRQCLLSAGILGALSVTGMLLGLIPGIAADAPQNANRALRVFYVAPVVVAFTTLVAVLVAVEVARLFWASHRTHPPAASRAANPLAENTEAA